MSNLLLEDEVWTQSEILLEVNQAIAVGDYSTAARICSAAKDYCATAEEFCLFKGHEVILEHVSTVMQALSNLV